MVKDNNMKINSEIAQKMQTQRTELDHIQGEVFRAIDTVDEKIKEINELLKLREWVTQNIKHSQESMKEHVIQVKHIIEVIIPLCYSI